jgi:tRNA-dihydrouridine synthase 3
VVPTADSVVISELEQQTDVEMKTTPGSDTPEPNFIVDIDNIAETRTRETNGPLSQVDTPDVPVRFSEKKRLHWAGKTCELNQL